MKKLVGLAVVAVVAVMMSGCSTYPVNFADKSIPMEQGKYTVIGNEIEGTDSQLIVLGYGLSMPGSPQRRALKDAMKKAPGADGMISMAIDQQMINLALVQIVTTRCTGTPVKLNNK